MGSQGTDRGQIRGAQTRARGQGFNIVLTRKSAATVRESDNIYCDWRLRGLKAGTWRWPGRGMLTPMSSTPSSQMTQTPSTTLSASVARY